MAKYLGSKSRCLLELLFLLGEDFMDALASSRSGWYRSAGFESDRAFYRCMRILKENGWIEGEDGTGSGEWVAALTREGKERLADRIEPEAAWASSWDGKWRTLSFDLPQEARNERHQLREWLKKRRFGHLQGSVWITHRAYDDWDSEIADRGITPSAVIFQETIPLGRFASGDYVQAAWSFGEINARYRDYVRFLDTQGVNGSSTEAHRRWREEEALVWRRAFELDPFLPEELLPEGYLGRSAWARRRRAYKAWASEIPVADEAGA